MKVGAVIVAAGRGTRAGDGGPKQWRSLAGRPVAQHAMQTFEAHPEISQIVLVLHPDDLQKPIWPREPLATVVVGGPTRSSSVQAGLHALNEEIDTVLIHDAARPCVTKALIDDVLTALQKQEAAAPALAVVDALWTGKAGRVTGVADRSGLYRAQTPQGFRLKPLLAAYQQHPDGAADDVEIARRFGIEVVITDGDEDNLKITRPEDFARAEAILKRQNGH